MIFSKNDIFLLSIILFFLLTRLSMYHSQALTWDEATYILIGKYFFGRGQIGFAEPFRPIIWPIILGTGWWLGLNPLLLGKVLTLLFSIGNIILVYLVGKKIYEPKTGIIAAIFLTLSSSHFFWGNTILTEIPSTFLGLISIYLFLHNKEFASGILGGVAFLTKFIQLLSFVAISGIQFLKNFQHRRVCFPSDFLKFALGWTSIISIFFIFNYIMYGSIFIPFIDAKRIYTQGHIQTHYSWLEGISLCLKTICQLESWIFLLIPISIVELFFDKHSNSKVLIFFMAVLFFIWVGLVPTELSRFFLPALPYLYLLSANGLMLSYAFLRRYSIGIKYIYPLCVVIFLGFQFYQLTKINFRKDYGDIEVFHRYLDQVGPINGHLWISNPKMVINHDFKIDQVMYYPVFDNKKISELRSHLSSADLILVDSRDLRCLSSDMMCQQEKEKLFKLIRENFKTDVYLYDPSDQQKFLGIFRRPNV